MLWAHVAELADAPDLGSGTRKGVEVQVLSCAPLETLYGLRYSNEHETLVFPARYARACRASLGR